MEKWTRKRIKRARGKWEEEEEEEEKEEKEEEEEVGRDGEIWKRSVGHIGNH